MSTISRILCHHVLLMTLLCSSSSLHTMTFPPTISTQSGLALTFACAAGTFVIDRLYLKRQRANSHETTIADIKKTMEESTLTFEPLGFIKHPDHFDRTFHEQTAPRIKRSFMSHNDPLKRNLPFTICYETADRYEQALIRLVATTKASTVKNNELEQLRTAATQAIAQLARFKQYLVNTEIHKEYENEQQALTQRIKEQQEHNIRMQQDQERMQRAKNDADRISVEAQRVKIEREQIAAQRETARATRQHTQELKHHVLCRETQQKLEKKLEGLEHKLRHSLEVLTQQRDTAQARINQQRNAWSAELQKLEPIYQQWKDAEGFPHGALGEAIALCQKQQKELNA